MENLCSNCGKTCNSGVHSNMKGNFQGKVYCNLCFLKFKNDLEERIHRNIRDGKNLWNSQANYDHLPYSEGQPIRNRIMHQCDSMLEQLRKLKDDYKNLTGFDWKR